MARIYFNYKTIDAPWGGGNSFLRNLKKALSDMPDMKIVENECDDYDIFFMNQLNRGPGREKNKPRFMTPYQVARIHNYGHESIIEMLKSIFTGRQNGKKIAMRLTNLRSHAYNQKHHIRDWMLMTALKHTDIDIFQSNYIKSVFEKAGYAKKNFCVIHNGVDQNIFNMDGKKFWDGTFPIKIYSSAFAERESKRFDIIASFSEIEHVECIHIGVWPSNIKPKKVKILNKMPQKDFARLLKEDAHIFLHPAEKDICPNGVIEALSCGLPVIYRNPGGTSEIVAGCGVEMFDSTKDALDKICSNFKFYIDNIEKKWQSFSIEYSAKLYADVFRNLLSG